MLGNAKVKEFRLEKNNTKAGNLDSKFESHLKYMTTIKYVVQVTLKNLYNSQRPSVETMNSSEKTTLKSI